MNKGDRVRCLSKRINMLFNKVGVIKSSQKDHVDYPISVEFVNPLYSNSNYKIVHSYKSSELKLINKGK